MFSAGLKLNFILNEIRISIEGEGVKDNNKNEDTKIYMKINIKIKFR